MFGNGFYNPYLYQPYYQAANMARGLGGIANASRVGSALGSSGALASSASGIGRGLLGRFSFSGFLNGASKTLNVVNQAIPIFYQVRPMINNAKTMFKVLGAVKEDNSSSTVRNQNIQNSEKTSSSTNSIEKENTYSKQIIEKEEATNNPVFFI